MFDQCHQQAGQATPVVQPTRSCAHCGASMEGKKTIARYCSRSCKENAKSKRETAAARVEKPCATCGEPIVGRQSTAKFCTDECSRVFYRKVPVATHCGFCGEPIVGRQSTAKFCSKTCTQAAWNDAWYGRMRTVPGWTNWRAMKARCLHRKSTHYRYYGAKGVKVHPEWVTSFSAFIAHIGPKPGPGWSIDRYPNTRGHYEPNNVRWATPQMQANNTTTNRLVMHRGVELSVTEWARLFGLPPDVLRYRLFKRGWDTQRALTEPVGTSVGVWNKGTGQRLTHNGESRTIAEWAKVCGLSDTAIRYRLNQGWDIGRILGTPRGPGGRKSGTQ
jgi:endogenous inhibitor of DNA gyrase (YacG/DUF329 family)